MSVAEEMFGIKTAAVGHAIGRVKNSLARDKRFRKSIEKGKQPIISALSCRMCDKKQEVFVSG